MNQLKLGRWRLKDLRRVKNNGLTVFSCFHCGGGSTMGYRLAGFKVLGGVEIDEKMMAIYRANHSPKMSYHMGIKEFNAIADAELPRELFNIDVLDGSPPCSSFSMSGSREKKWSTESVFREGQSSQVLDDLFFHFIDTARKLKPKVIVAENVKGLMIGNARGYVKEILTEFKRAGYDCQLFLLNAARMGVPQKRERVFFLARRSDLGLPAIKLEFNEPVVTIGDATGHLTNQAVSEKLFVKGENLTAWRWCMNRRKPFFYNFFDSPDGGSKRKKFNWCIAFGDKPGWTLASAQRMLSDKEPRFFTDGEIIACQTFPEDFDFVGVDVQYVCGMSVPPFMMQRVASEIEKQWLAPS